LATKPADIESWLAQLGQPSADRDYKPGHERMRELLASLPLHRPKLRIRVAGTNGKGSTSHMLANALHAAGLKVGLYTSPHILHFNERIRIDGIPVADDRILQQLDRLMPTALACGASYFETATAAALGIFSEEKVDVEILEAGVGARLDATTAVPADMALLTPIGLDHQAWLGETIESVASEKSYAADGCQWVISAVQQPAVLSILEARAPGLLTAEPDASLSLEMHGDHQRQNGALAWKAVQALAAAGRVDAGRLPDARSAIEATVVPGRLQKRDVGDATLWLDAAHNRHAIEALLPTLTGLHLDSVFVFTREDRDLRECIPLFRQCTRRVIGVDGSVFDAGYPSIREALDGELGSNPSGNHLILGSFLTVAAALQWIR